MDLILLFLFVIAMTQIAILIISFNPTDKKVRKLFISTSFSCKTMKEVESELYDRLSRVVSDFEYDIKINWNEKREEYDVLILAYERK